MARAMHALSDCIDHVFSGESETTFVEFLRRHRDGKPLGAAIVEGEPCMNLEALPKGEPGSAAVMIERALDEWATSSRGTTP